MRTVTSGDMAYFPIPAIHIASVTTASTPDTCSTSSATQKQRYAEAKVSVISNTVSLYTHDHVTEYVSQLPTDIICKQHK